MNKPTWNDLRPGDTVIEHDGNKAVFVIAKESELRNHWDVVVLSSNHPNNDTLTAYRQFWIRRCGSSDGPGPIPIPPNHEVVREGKTICRT